MSWHPLFSSFCSHTCQLLLMLSQLSSTVRATSRTHVPHCSISRLHCLHRHEPADAWLRFFKCIRSPTCRALVCVRTLALTNPGPPPSHAANSSRHKSCTLIHEVATARRLRITQLRQEFHVICVLPPASSVLVFIEPEDAFG